VRLEGRFDESRQVLLTGRFADGEPGVEVVTPLLLPGDSTAVPVLRGWLRAEDPESAHPEAHAEPSGREVLGFATAIGRSTPGSHGFPWRTVRADSVAIWSTRALDADSLARRLPYAIAPYLVRELPGPGEPETPRRGAPEPYDEFVHVSYAIQWFAFGAILLIGSAWLAWSRRRARGAAAGR
jgi:cytochrome oxidase assembly protein ShyY1